MKFFTLIALFVLRPIRTEKFPTFLSILGIALGIGLFLGVKVASDRAVSSFEADIRGINPRANYEVFDTSGIDFREQVYKDILSFDGKSLPVLKTSGYLPRFRESLDINGIYTVKALDLLSSSQKKQDGREDFFRTPNGIAVTEEFARRKGLKLGDRLNALVYDKACSLVIVDIIRTERLPANTAIMDLGNCQEFFGKTGFLSRIDLAANEKTAGDIRGILPPNLALEKKETMLKNRTALVKSFRYNLQFISLIAILVGMFLLYNTVFISVVKRRTEIGILRGLGAGWGTIAALFTMQGALLGLTGSVIGIAFGQAAAYFSVIAVEKTITSMYGSISISDYLITGWDALTALLLGCAVSLCASFIPAYASSRITPHESSREGTFEESHRRRAFSFSSGVACVAAGAGLSYVEYLYTPFEFPFLAYAGMLFIIAGFTLAAPSYLSTILKLMKRPLERVFGATGKIALNDMRGNVYRFSVALMSVAVSSALVIALLVLIFSFRNSLKIWIEKNISADIYIKPSSCGSNFCFYPISDEVAALARGMPEVAGVDRFRTLYLDLFGGKVVAGFADTALQEKLSRERGGRLEERSRLSGVAREVSISDYLAVKYGLKKGDTLELPTPKGRAAFTIHETFSSYSTTSGFIYADRRWLKEYWGLDDATQLSVYLKPGSDVAAFILKLNDALGGRYSLDIMNNGELRDRVLNIFNRTFAITYAIEFISIIVSLIGVINTLLAFVLERKREISIIRYLGGSWEQIRNVLTLSAGAVGITGIFLGSLMGTLMSVIFIRVVNKVSFGWEIHFSIPVLYLSAVMAALFLTTLVAGIIPAGVARKIDPKRYISFE